ncbi:hypothetical protein Mapa_017300 [Marchantia paleacea]|nr:hypothetical protein Mapa_017300 [Marchantia paleacea]
MKSQSQRGAILRLTSRYLRNRREKGETRHKHALKNRSGRVRSGRVRLGGVGSLGCHQEGERRPLTQLLSTLVGLFRPKQNQRSSVFPQPHFVYSSRMEGPTEVDGRRELTVADDAASLWKRQI